MLCNLLAKAPFQTEMRVVRPKMGSLITDIHCWHLSSVCQGWRRKEMVFREPEIQESVTLKPTAECNMLMPGWNSWQFTWAMLKCSGALLGNKQSQTGTGSINGSHLQSPWGLLTDAHLTGCCHLLYCPGSGIVNVWRLSRLFKLAFNTMRQSFPTALLAHFEFLIYFVYF